MRRGLAIALAAVLFGPVIAVQHVFWLFWGMWGYLLGLIAGEEEQVRIWHTIQVGPTYSSTLLGPLWSYFGHEPEHRASAHAIAQGGRISRRIELLSVEHEDSAFTFSRTRTPAVYNMGGAESRPLIEDH